MRWTYLISRVLFIAALWAFIAFGLDPLLRYSTVQSLQSITGARADVAALSTTFFPPSLTISSVALASQSRPGKNLFEFDELQVGFEPSALSRRRFVVEDAHITGLRFDTRRSDVGQLEEPVEPDSDEPSWMAEQLTKLGDEWLLQMADQVKAQLDPNELETYRIGTATYTKWDARFQDMAGRVKLMKPRVRQLKIDFEDARKVDALKQIEQYILVAERAEVLVRDAQLFRDELTGIVPEVREDFQQLNAARKRDQEQVLHKLSLLKPDARRFSEALLGEPMYRRIQEVLTWVQVAQEYQHQLQEQVQPERGKGRDFEFLAGNPAPDFLLKKLWLSGTMSLKKERIPFTATLSDVTEDPKLLARPCVMQLEAAGSRPMQLQVAYDATGDKSIVAIAADFADTDELSLQAGNPAKACLTATLNNVHWSLQFTQTGGQIDGQIRLESRIGDLLFETSENIFDELTDAANQALSTVQQLSATVSLCGAITHPTIQLQSDLGEQIAVGVQLAMAQQLELARERLLAEVNTLAGDQVEKLKSRFSGEYDRLKTENRELLQQVNEVRTIVATLKSGKADPSTVLRQVSNSKLIPEKDTQKVNNVINDVQQTLEGNTLPESLQNRLPGALQQRPGSARQPRPASSSN